MCVYVYVCKTVGAKVIVSSGDVEKPFVADVVKVKKTKMAKNKKSTTLVGVKWYYYPEDTKWGRRAFHGRAEVFESNHKDEIHLESIIDVCQVVGVDEYSVRMCKTPCDVHCMRRERERERCRCCAMYICVCEVFSAQSAAYIHEREYDMIRGSESVFVRRGVCMRTYVDAYIYNVCF